MNFRHSKRLYEVDDEKTACEDGESLDEDKEDLDKLQKTREWDEWKDGIAHKLI